MGSGHRYIYGYENGNCVGYLSGAIFYNMNGSSTHNLIGTYLYNNETGDSDFWIDGRYIYSE